MIFFHRRIIALIAAVLCLLLAHAAARRCVVTSTSVRPITWTVSSNENFITLGINLADENRYEDDTFNYLQGAALTFGPSCDPWMSFIAVADKTIRITSGSHWTVTYEEPVDASACGSWQFERTFPIWEALSYTNCFNLTQLPETNSSKFQLSTERGTLKRVYGVTTRTYAHTRFLEDTLNFSGDFGLVNPLFTTTTDSSAVLLKSSELIQQTPESYLLRALLQVAWPVRLTMSQAFAGSAAEVVSLAFNCSESLATSTENIICEYIVDISISKLSSPCLTPESEFVAALRSSCIQQDGITCPNNGTLNIRIIPETPSCVLNSTGARKWTTQMISVRGPTVDALRGPSWSTQHKPLIPYGIRGYFTVDISATVGGAFLVEVEDVKATVGPKFESIEFQQDLTDASCRQDRACVIISAETLQKYSATSAYTTVGVIATLKITALDQSISFTASSSTTVDLLSALQFNNGANAPPAPQQERVGNDVIGFSIAIAAGIVVLLSALAGFAVSFKVPALNPQQTGPTAAGAGV